ncbi:response regulator [Candidatus Parcubacteria bacterium]|nr:response regulator [Candidatus Parcubacteria bacterium]
MIKVLLVEDDASILNAYSFIFAKKGYQVYPASTAREGLALAAEQRPEVIVLDMLMPQMSGLDFLRQLQPKTTLPNSKVVVMSNTESPKIIEEATGLGADRYLLKVDHTPGAVADVVADMLAQS